MPNLELFNVATVSFCSDKTGQGKPAAVSPEPGLFSHAGSERDLFSQAGSAQDLFAGAKAGPLFSDPPPGYDLFACGPVLPLMFMG